MKYFFTPDVDIILSQSRCAQFVIGIDPGHSKSKTAYTILAIMSGAYKYRSLPLSLRGSVQRSGDRANESIISLPMDGEELVFARVTHIGILFLIILHYFLYFSLLIEITITIIITIPIYTYHIWLSYFYYSRALSLLIRMIITNNNSNHNNSNSTIPIIHDVRVLSLHWLLHSLQTRM